MKIKRRIVSSLVNQNKVSIWPMVVMVTIIATILIGFLLVHALGPADLYRDIFHFITSLLFLGLLGLAAYEIISKNILIKKIEMQNKVVIEVAEELPFGIVIFDHHHQMKYLNTWMSDFIDQHDKDHFFESLKVDEKEFSPQEMVEYVDLKNQVYYLSLLKQNYLDFEGRSQSVIFVNDVTPTQQLKKKEIQAEKMETFTHLTRVVSHDFNNLLMGIGGHASMLLNTEDYPKEHVEKILHATELASQLIQKLAMIPNQSDGFNPQLISIGDAIDHAKSHFTYKSQQVVHFYQEEAVKAMKIFGDPVLIESTFINLIKNAFEAMDDRGRVQIELTSVEVDPSQSDDYILPIYKGVYIKAAISDEGRGVVGKIDKIFDPLFTTKTFGSGHGIGLTAVYHTLEIHHGGLSVHKNEGPGMTFELYFPYELDKRVLKNKKVALFEDDDIIVDLLKATLKEDQIDWLTVGADLEDYHILVTDLGVHDKLETFLFDCLTTYPDLLIVVISGYFSQEEMAVFSHYSNVYPLLKPINLIYFKALINYLYLR